MIIPKYPSSESVAVLPETEGFAVFETRLKLVGVGCMEVALPAQIVRASLGIHDEAVCEDDMVKFVGVHRGKSGD